MLKLKLKLQHSDHWIQRADSLEKSLILGKTEVKGEEGKDETVGWHHQLSRHEHEQALGDGEGQGSLACCSPCGRKESDGAVSNDNDNKL